VKRERILKGRTLLFSEIFVTVCKVFRWIDLRRMTYREKEECDTENKVS
jgi:hypothetical protein